jgi:parallel beta-helix repeat protein
MRPALVLLVVFVFAPAAPAPAGECGGQTPCACGDTLSGHVKLDADLGPCEADGLVLRESAALDCAGHTIRGAGRPIGPDRAAATYGVILDGNRGAVVKNCKVTGFTYGIELSGARDSRVTGSEAWHNGDFNAHVGYGIHFSRAVGNTVESSTVRDSADEGIHIGGDSDRNVVVGNQSYDNFRENYYVLSARGNRLTKNRGRGRVSANLYMKHAVDTVVEGNRFEERPVVVRGRSTGNVFADNVLGGGVKFESYREGQTEDAPTGNVVRGGHILGRGSCIEFIGADRNRVETPVLEGCSGIVARATRSTSNDLLGFDVAGVRLDLAGGATLRLLAAVTVRVETAKGAPVPNARVRFQERSDRDAETVSTDSTGTATIEIPTHVVSAGGLIPVAAPQLTAEADGYPSTRVTLPASLPGKTTVVLGAAAAATPAPAAKRGARPIPRR